MRFVRSSQRARTRMSSALMYTCRHSLVYMFVGYGGPGTLAHRGLITAHTTVCKTRKCSARSLRAPSFASKLSSQVGNDGAASSAHDGAASCGGAMIEKARAPCC